MLGLRQNFQPLALAGPTGRPRPNVEISAAVQAPLLGHIVLAIVVASDNEQPDQADLGNQPTLRRLPRMDERQLPSGDGLPPVSQPFFNGLEPDLPATEREDD